MATILEKLKQKYPDFPAAKNISEALAGRTGAQGIAEATGTYRIYLSFDPNGGSGTVDTMVGYTSIMPNSGGLLNVVHFVLPNAEGLTPPEGKTFAGWKIKDTATRVYHPGETFSLNRSSWTLLAYWADAAQE